MSHIFYKSIVLRIICLTITLLLWPQLETIAAERAVGVRATTSPYSLEGYDTGNFHALIIGIDAYQTLPSLRTAVRDAEAIGELLYQKYGFKKENIKLLKNSQASRSGILEILARYRDILTEKDSLLIYYAGHGRLENNNSRLGYWVPVDGRADTVIDDISHTVLIENFLKFLRVKHLLVLSDSCFGGGLHRSATSTKDKPYSLYQLSKSFAKPSRWILSSGDELETVPDDAGNGHSPFCNRILQYLGSADKPFDVIDLYYHARKRLNRQKPTLDNLDTEAHQAGGSFVFMPKGFQVHSSGNQQERFSDAFVNLLDEEKLEQATPKEPVPMELPTLSSEALDTNFFLISNPVAGIMRFGRHEYDLKAGAELQLAEGVYPFSLDLEGERRTIYGKFEVLVVDDETANATFGADDPLFKENHIAAALKGSPVRYSIGLLSGEEQKKVARYTLSLRKIH